MKKLIQALLPLIISSQLFAIAGFGAYGNYDLLKYPSGSNKDRDLGVNYDGFNNAAGFGFLGYILRRLNWPLVPIVLGMVLGQIMIEKLTAGAGKIKFWLDIVNRPVSGFLTLTIFLVILGTLISYVYNNYKKTN